MWGFAIPHQPEVTQRDLQAHRLRPIVNHYSTCDSQFGRSCLIRQRASESPAYEQWPTGANNEFHPSMRIAVYAIIFIVQCCGLKLLNTALHRTQTTS